MSPGPKSRYKIEFIRGSDCPIRIYITIEKTIRIDLCFDISMLDALSFAKLLAKRLDIDTNIRFVSQQNWEFDTYWAYSPTFIIRCKPVGTNFSTEIEMGTNFARGLSENIMCALSGQPDLSSEIVKPGKEINVDEHLVRQRDDNLRRVFG